jgi:hypothetical protein
MIRAVLRAMCGVLIVLGLMWIYTLFYGGPFIDLFAWLNQYLPQNVQISLPSTALKPVTGT